MVDSCAEGPCNMSFQITHDNESMIPVESVHSRIIPKKHALMSSTATTSEPCCYKQVYTKSQLTKLALKQRILRLCTHKMLTAWFKSIKFCSKFFSVVKSAYTDESIEPAWKAQYGQVCESPINCTNNRIDVFVFTLPFTTFANNWELRNEVLIQAGNTDKLTWNEPTSTHPSLNGVKFFYEMENETIKLHESKHSDTKLCLSSDKPSKFKLRNSNDVTVILSSHAIELSRVHTLTTSTTSTTTMPTTTVVVPFSKRAFNFISIETSDAYALRCVFQVNAAQAVVDFFWNAHSTCTPKTMEQYQHQHTEQPNEISAVHECSNLWHIGRSGFLILPCGLGKTNVGWHAVKQLYNSGVIHSVLLVCNYKKSIPQSLSRLASAFEPSNNNNSYTVVNLSAKKSEFKAMEEKMRMCVQMNKADHKRELHVVAATMQLLTHKIDQFNDTNTTTTAKSDTDETTALDTEIGASGYHRKFELVQKYLCQCDDECSCKTLVLVDEAQCCAATQYRHLMTQVCPSFKVPYRLGMSASIERKDGKRDLALMVMGKYIYKVDVLQLKRELKLHVTCNANYSLAPRTAMQTLQQNLLAFDKYADAIENAANNNNDFSAQRTKTNVQHGQNATLYKKGLVANHIPRAQYTWFTCVYERTFVKYGYKRPMLFVSSVQHFITLIKVYNSIVAAAIDIVNSANDHSSKSFAMSHEVKMQILDFCYNVIVDKTELGGDSKTRVPKLANNPFYQNKSIIPEFVTHANKRKRCLKSVDMFQVRKRCFANVNNTAAVVNTATPEKQECDDNNDDIEMEETFSPGVPVFNNNGVRVILATLQFAGVAYDDPSVDSLIFNDKPIDNEQNMGRLRAHEKGMIMIVNDENLNGHCLKNRCAAKKLFVKIHKLDVYNDDESIIKEKSQISQYM